LAKFLLPFLDLLFCFLPQEILPAMNDGVINKMTPRFWRLYGTVDVAESASRHSVQ